MILKSLALRGFRNYSNLEVSFDPSLNWIKGENGEGKTNLLEAIYYLSTLSTFRSVNSDLDLVQWGVSAFSINGELKDDQREISLDISYSETGKIEKANGKRITKHSDLHALFPVVLFSPLDIAITQGSPAARRRWLDSLLKQLLPQYHQLTFQYNRALLQRNRLLRLISQGKSQAGELEAWDNSVAQLGTEITKHRLSALQQINPICGKLHSEVSDFREKLTLSYQVPFILEEGTALTSEVIKAELRSRRQEEIRSGHTMVGPHRDDVVIRINGKDLKIYGSQGQQRSAVLSLKMAELKLMQDRLSLNPALLLDDVMSELDSKRQNQLLGIIAGCGQVFVTSIEECSFPINATIAVYQVRSGMAARINY